MSVSTRYVLVVLILGAFVLSAISPSASLAEEKPKVVFVLIDNVTWDDIITANDPFFNELTQTGAIGLLNNRTYGRPSRARTAITVGSGVRANALPGKAGGYNATDEVDFGKAGDVYFVRTGRQAKPHNIVELGLPAIIADNDYINQDIVPGALGQLLKEKGLKTAVLGNSDTSLKSERSFDNREIVCVAMDAGGIVDYGDVGKSVLVHDPRVPFGIRSNDTLLLEKFEAMLEVADFIAIDYGETTRADHYSAYVLKARAVRLKSAAVKRAGAFIRQAMEAAGDNTVFVVASLSPPGAGESPVSGKEEQLTPVIISGPGYGPGSLTSSSTRRPGIINNTDIPVAILDIFGIKPHYTMVGSNITLSKERVSAEQLSSFNKSAIGIKSARRTAILAFIYIQIVLYAMAALLLLYARKANMRYISFIETLILTSMGFPLFTFFASKIDYLAVHGVLLTLVSLAASLVLASLLRGLRYSTLFPLAAISAATLITILVDVVTGASLQLNTVFGYDPIRGSRFFGIGNEAFSILLVSALLTIGFMFERWKRSIAMGVGTAIAVVVLFVDGFPAFGADVGGIIAITAGFTAMALHIQEVKVNYRNILIACALVGMALGVFVAYDVLNGSSTHMGKSVELISSSGVSGALTIISRKLATNIMVLRYSTWSYFLLVIMLLTIALSYRPVGLLKKLFARHQGLAASVTGAVIGSIIGFAVNDSGILIPAIMMSYIFPSIAYLMLWEKYETR
jgi:hypothetical protein